MRFADLVATSAAVAATRSRLAKITALAAAIGQLDADELEAGAAMLAGEPRQRRLGVGGRALEVEVAPSDQPDLTVRDVDAALAALATCAGAGSQTERARLIGGLFARASAAEQSFMRRLLTEGLRQGALEGVMVDAIARAATVEPDQVRRAAMLSGNLARTAVVAMREGATGLAAVGLQVGRPVQPMLAATSADVASAIDEVGLASVECKLDGARVQVHRDGDQVRLYTRNLNDVTARLPAIVEAVRAMPARAFVLDGEAIGFDEDERPGVFQDTMSRFGQHDGGTGPALAARFFDLLHLDGVDLIDRPLTERLAALDGLVGPLAVPRVITADIDVARQFSDAALAAGHEGVMIKAVASPYEAGRRGSSWRKVKPVRTFDLVVLGVEWGSGRRQGWLSNLHLGARDPDGGGFVMVGKTFKGLTDALLAWQTEQLLARKTGETGAVVWVRPELVVEIALDGAQRSTRYPGGVALRFARVKRYREDKLADQADTLDAIRALLK